MEQRTIFSITHEKYVRLFGMLSRDVQGLDRVGCMLRLPGPLSLSVPSLGECDGLRVQCGVLRPTGRAVHGVPDAYLVCEGNRERIGVLVQCGLHGTTGRCLLTMPPRHVQEFHRLGQLHDLPSEQQVFSRLRRSLRLQV